MSLYLWSPPRGVVPVSASRANAISCLRTRPRSTTHNDRPLVERKRCDGQEAAAVIARLRDGAVRSSCQGCQRLRAAARSEAHSFFLHGRPGRRTAIRWRSAAYRFKSPLAARVTQRLTPLMRALGRGQAGDERACSEGGREDEQREAGPRRTNKNAGYKKPLFFAVPPHETRNEANDETKRKNETGATERKSCSGQKNRVPMMFLSGLSVKLCDGIRAQTKEQTDGPKTQRRRAASREDSKYARIYV